MTEKYANWTFYTLWAAIAVFGSAALVYAIAPSGLL